jgi:hypothetical protein
MNRDDVLVMGRSGIDRGPLLDAVLVLHFGRLQESRDRSALAKAAHNQIGARDAWMCEQPNAQRARPHQPQLGGVLTTLEGAPLRAEARRAGLDSDPREAG